MDKISLQISINNNDITQKYCKECDIYHPCSLFINNKNKIVRICNMCCTQDKKRNISKKQPEEHDNEIIVDFYDFYDHIMQFFDLFEDEKVDEDQENLKSLEFEFSCTVNISALEGDLKERTNCIIEIISD
ncbi:1650_t:CDS:1, partial [Cetraspora pellucida]